MMDDLSISRAVLNLRLATVLVRASGHRAFVKAVAASISSTWYTLISLKCKGSRKVRFSGGYNVPLAANPFNSWANVLDCGDIPVTS